jgi:hypothetical protein
MKAQLFQMDLIFYVGIKKHEGLDVLVEATYG